MTFRSLAGKLVCLACIIALGRPDVAMAWLLPDNSPSTATVEKRTLFTGTITCGKCDLKRTVKCATVLEIKEAGGSVLFYFDDVSNKKYHKHICVQGLPGTVTGEVIETKNQLTLQVKKVEFRK
jgi:hypothetical protein